MVLGAADAMALLAATSPAVASCRGAGLQVHTLCICESHLLPHLSTGSATDTNLLAQLLDSDLQTT